jgi:hypothetical protein
MEHDVRLASSRVVAMVMVGLWQALAVASDRQERVGDLLLRVQEQSAAPLVRHCAAMLPDTRRALEAEYSRYKKKFRKAAQPLQARIRGTEELAKPATAALRAQFDGMQREDIARVAALDPRSFCATLRGNLAAATVESIQHNLQSAFAQYAAAARQGR